MGSRLQFIDTREKILAVFNFCAQPVLKIRDYEGPLILVFNNRSD